MAFIKKTLASSGVVLSLAGLGVGVNDYKDSLSILNVGPVEDVRQQDGTLEVIVTMDREKKRERGYRFWLEDREFEEKYRDEITEYLDFADSYVAHLTQEQIDELRKDPNIYRIEYNKKPEFLLDEAIPYVHTGSIMGIRGLTGSGVFFCGLDSAYYRHDFLPAPYKMYDSWAQDNNAMSDGGHGMQTSGVALSSHPVWRGYAPDAYWMPCLVNSAQTQFANCMDWCADNGGDVIHLSFTVGDTTLANCDSEFLAQVVNDITDRGVAVFGSSGNAGNDDRVAIPACASKAAAVGQTNAFNVRTGSNGGPALDLMVYSAGIFSLTGQKRDFGDLSGTSFASPTAAGIAAILKQANPNLTPSQIIHIMGKTATDLGAAGRDDLYGSGMVNVLAALNEVRSGLGQPAFAAPKLFFYEDFEDTLASDWTVSGDWQTTTYNAFEYRIQGPYDSWRRLEQDTNNNLGKAYVRNCSTECTITMTGSLSLAGYTGALLSFYRMMDIALESTDYLKVDAFDGTSWRNIHTVDTTLGEVQKHNANKYGQLARTEDSPVWFVEQIVLSGALMTDSFKLRLRGKAWEPHTDLRPRENIIIDGIRVREHFIP